MSKLSAWLDKNSKPLLAILTAVIVIIAPILGLSVDKIGDQAKEIEALTTTVVLETEPVVVEVKRDDKVPHHDHPEFAMFKKLQADIDSQEIEHEGWH